MTDNKKNGSDKISICLSIAMLAGFVILMMFVYHGYWKAETEADRLAQEMVTYTKEFGSDKYVPMRKTIMEQGGGYEVPITLTTPLSFLDGISLMPRCYAQTPYDTPTPYLTPTPNPTDTPDDVFRFPESDYDGVVSLPNFPESTWGGLYDIDDLTIFDYQQY